jgi:hypothetical protein
MSKIDVDTLILLLLKEGAIKIDKKLITMLVEQNTEEDHLVTILLNVCFDSEYVLRKDIDGRKAVHEIVKLAKKTPISCTVLFDQSFDFLKGRVLDLSQMQTVFTYLNEYNSEHRLESEFSAGSFHKIIFRYSVGYLDEQKYYALALTDDLLQWPTFRINLEGKDKTQIELRKIVFGYLCEHPELNISIDEFY